VTNPDPIPAVIAKLEADTTLRTLLGGAGRVRFGHLSQHEQIPGVYVTGGTTNTSTPAFGYRVSRLRDNDDTVQLDVWAMTPEAALAIAKRLDPVVFDGISGLTLIHRVGGMDPAPDPERSEIWHATARYAFEYRLRDTI